MREEKVACSTGSIFCTRPNFPLRFPPWLRRNSNSVLSKDHNDIHHLCRPSTPAPFHFLFSLSKLLPDAHLSSLLLSTPIYICRSWERRLRYADDATDLWLVSEKTNFEHQRFRVCNFVNPEDGLQTLLDGVAKILRVNLGKSRPLVVSPAMEATWLSTKGSDPVDEERR